MRASLELVLSLHLTLFNKITKLKQLQNDWQSGYLFFFTSRTLFDLLEVDFRTVFLFSGLILEQLLWKEFFFRQGSDDFKSVFVLQCSCCRLELGLSLGLKA